jgi:hypothetical protein
MAENDTLLIRRALNVRRCRFAIAAAILATVLLPAEAGAHGHRRHHRHHHVAHRHLRRASPAIATTPALGVPVTDGLEETPTELAEELRLVRTREQAEVEVPEASTPEPGSSELSPQEEAEDATEDAS